MNTRECAKSPASPEAQGRRHAAYIVKKLIPALKPEHAFYYEFLSTSSGCSNHEEGQLFVPSGEAGAPPDRPRPAAAFIYDGKGFPWAYTASASKVEAEKATLEASIYPGGLLPAEYQFEYGLTTKYGDSSSEGLTGSGLARTDGSSEISNLKANTTYHYRVVAWNSEGTSPPSADGTFRTLPLPPEATTQPASDVGEMEARLNGTVNPNEVNTRYYFQYGTTTSYGSSTPEGDAGSGGTPVPETATITGNGK